MAGMAEMAGSLSERACLYKAKRAAGAPTKPEGRFQRWPPRTIAITCAASSVAAFC